MSQRPTSSQLTSRRLFLATTVAGVSLSISPAARSANNILRVGVIGTGARGKHLIGNLPETVQVAAVCDCSTARVAETLEPKGNFAAVLQRFRENDAHHCTSHQDYRRMFDRDKLDAVIIATPDHHHTLAAMLALQAGLDVYLEKPLTVSIREGRLLAIMVKKTGRVLQVGSQQRTMEINRIGCEFIRKGGLGKISRVELPNYPGPITEPTFAEEEKFRGIDWNLFCGPTPLRPHHRQIWVKDEFKIGDLTWRAWDLYRDYSGHLMTNWGAHSVDMVQLALGRDDTGPVEVRAIEPDSSAALSASWKDKTPAAVGNERRFWPVEMRYADGLLLQFVHGTDFIRFHGEKGSMRMKRNFFEIDPPELMPQRPDPSLAAKWNGTGHIARPHLENWIDCIRTRSTPNAPVEVGHRTVSICHLANLAREINRPLKWNPEQEQFINDNDANRLLDRPRRAGFELPAV